MILTPTRSPEALSPVTLFVTPLRSSGRAGCVRRVYPAAVVLVALVLGLCLSAYGQGHDHAAMDPPAGSAAEEQDSHDHGPKQSSSLKPVLRKLFIPAGITALSLIAVTVTLGLLRRMKLFGGPRLAMKIHKITGVCALLAGAAHLTIKLILYS